MDDDTDLLFDLPSVARKKVSAAFDGGRNSSNGGVADRLRGDPEFKVACGRLASRPCKVRPPMRG